MKRLTVLLSLLMVAGAAHADLNKDFDSLGGNTPLLEKAKALNPQVVTTIVQDRTVSRRKRVEISPEFSGAFGGDTYSRTHSVGLNVQYHLNPRWSLAAKYNHNFNRLTAEGEAMVDQAWEEYQRNPRDPKSPIPALDYPLSEKLALVNWYPIYGKVSWFGKAVTQFDLYAIAGGGQVSLKSGDVGTWTGGLGLGLWLSQHVTARLELRYQRYTAQYQGQDKDLDLAVTGLQMGWML